MGNAVTTLTELTCAAPAKLNLFLHIIGRRADGYHLLQTVFRFIDLSDTLHFVLRDDGLVQRVSTLEGVPPEQDLCVRAARLLQNECGCRLGVDITVQKRIPLGGGLGGGSSDAATTLMALNRLWNLGLSRARLMQLGLSLGADVPVFLFGENALASGVGEQLQAYPLPDAQPLAKSETKSAVWYLVLLPPVHVATAKIFSCWDAQHADMTRPELTPDAISLRIRGLSFQPPDNDQPLGNDLQPVVCDLYPEVAQHLVWLEQFSSARMTGSGACVFAEFADFEQAQSVLSKLPPTMRGVVARGLAHHPLLNFAV